jgi:ABC-type Na+ efflux pump permease subunit
MAYVCINGDSERHIRVLYTYTGQKVPCEVVYEKASGSQSLWDAQNEEGYCEAKALELVEKQRGWGWDCAAMDQTNIKSSEVNLPTTNTPQTTPENYSSDSSVSTDTETEQVKSD